MSIRDTRDAYYRISLQKDGTWTVTRLVRNELGREITLNSDPGFLSEGLAEQFVRTMLEIEGGVLR